MITPEAIRDRRRDAELVQDMLNAALVQDTSLRRSRYEECQEWFEKKHHCAWQNWVSQKKPERQL